MRRLLNFDARMLANELHSTAPAHSRMLRLNEAVAGLVDDYSMVSFVPLG
jgi:hypothetical protein